MNSSDRLKLKKLLSELRKQRALHTEFVSVYIPAGYDISKVISQLQDEYGTATNIKSAVTKKNVQGALEKIIQFLKTLGKTPENGIAVFAGNSAAREGKTDFNLWSYEPHIPNKLRIYRCDKTFEIEPIEGYLIENDVYGLVVLDRRDANLALLRGKNIEMLTKTHSEVPGKFKAGGQSAQRFARLREEAYKEHFKKVADHMKEQFLHLGNHLKGIIIGGPGVTVNSFLGKDYITGDVKNKIIGTKDLSYTGVPGLHELVDRSEDLLANEEIAKEKRLMGKFFEMLNKETNKVTYGEKQTLDALEMGAVETLLISESFPEEKIFELEEKCETMSTNMEIISLDTREGTQLANMGKIAALLRYAI